MSGSDEPEPQLNYYTEKARRARTASALGADGAHFGILMMEITAAGPGLRHQDLGMIASPATRAFHSFMSFECYKTIYKRYVRADNVTCHKRAEQYILKKLPSRKIKVPCVEHIRLDEVSGRCCFYLMLPPSCFHCFHYYFHHRKNFPRCRQSFSLRCCFPPAHPVIH